MACVGTYTVPFEFQYGNIPTLVEKAGEKTFDGTIAEFVNSPNARGWVPGIDFLEAQITFFDREGGFVHRVTECLWIGKGDSYIRQLQAGRRARLIVSIVAFDDMFAAQRVGEGPSDGIYPLTRDFYRVVVNLNTNKEPFTFDLMRKPHLTLQEVKPGSP
jgi:hypothetical protein